MSLNIRDPFYHVQEYPKPEVNPFVAKMQAAASAGDLGVIYGSDLAKFRGRWLDQLAIAKSVRSQSLVFEIGSHYGKSICAMAADHKDIHFVGADITYKRVCKTAECARRGDLSNVSSIMFNGSFIEEIFSTAELRGLVIFFPDPWTKRRKAKHRLINVKLAQAAFRVIESGGFAWIKTDQDSYFEDAKGVFLDAGFVLSDALPLGDKVYKSRFEEIFEEKGLPTFSAVFRKPDIASQ